MDVCTETQTVDFGETDFAIDVITGINEIHRPEPLPDEKLVELDRILTAADNVAENLG